MAGELLTDIQNALSQTFRGDLVRTWNRSTPTASSFRVVDGAGKNAAWEAEFDAGLAAAHADGSDVAASEFKQDPIVPATLPWALYRAPFSVSKTEIAAAFSTPNVPEAVRNIFKERVFGAFTRLAATINYDIINGTGTDGSGNPTIVGLLGGALEATGTYAGISRATYAGWAGNVLGAGGVGRPLSVDLLDTLEQNVFTVGGESANLVLSGPGIFRKYKGLWEQEREIQTSGQGPNAVGTMIPTMTYNGAPVRRDKDIPAGIVLELNTNYIEIQQLRMPNLAPYIGPEFAINGSNGVDGDSQPTGLVANFEALANTGDSVKINVYVKVQLVVRKPNRQGYVSDVISV